MSYSKDYRERTIEYRQEGHTLEETHQTFKVAISTIQRWEQQLKEMGGVREERAAPKFPKDRSRKAESLCGGASRCIPVGDGRGVWMQRKRHTGRP